MTREWERRLAAARVAQMASVAPDGRPHLVPICFALDRDVLYSAVDEKSKRSKRLQRLVNVRANPEVCVLVDHYEEDWSRLWWARLRGQAEVHESGADRDRALALLHAKYEQYRAEPPTGAVIVVRVDDVRTWSERRPFGRRLS